MEFDIHRGESGAKVACGLARGELNQWLLDACPEAKDWDGREFEEYLYDDVSDQQVLGVWDTTNGVVLVVEADDE